MVGDFRRVLAHEPRIHPPPSEAGYSDVSSEITQQATTGFPAVACKIHMVEMRGVELMFAIYYILPLCAF